MDSINIFFLSRLNELNRILRRRPHPTHCEEVPGVGWLIKPIAMLSSPAFRSAMVVLFFDVDVLTSYFYYLFLR
jgi:hypothetical protein